MSFIVVGYYTEGSSYREEIQGLIKSCANFQIPCITKGYPTRGNWHENTSMKPEVILDFMREYPESDIVYLDADAIVQQYPRIFDDTPADIAVHFRNGKELLSGTIFIKNTEKMMMFIKCWIGVQCNNPMMNDQQSLQETIRKYAQARRVVVEDLPPTYTQIYDLMKDAGKPVIEHFQASRRFKNQVAVTKTIPTHIDGMLVRAAGDGSFYLPRCSRRLERILSEDYFKFKNELRWYPKQRPGRPLSELQPYFEGRDCYIVGKGPSLDRLAASDFPDPRLPILCINESIHKVESLGLPNKVHVMQQDAWLKDTCRPRFGSILLTHSCQFWYPDVNYRYVFGYLDVGMKTNNITVTYAISLGKMFGSTGFRMLCFDSCTTGSFEYGSCIGYKSSSGGSVSRFASHKQTILNIAAPIPVTFVKPSVPDSASPYRYQQS